MLSAFRFFDTDHQLHISLNEFAQGIEYLRVKIGFDMIKDVFSYLDDKNTGQISYSEFSRLSEENLSKKDIIDFTMTSFINRRRSQIQTTLNSVKPLELPPDLDVKGIKNQKKSTDKKKHLHLDQYL